MSAGQSADTEAQRQLALAAAHEQAAAQARATAAKYGIAAVTEKETARKLAPLAAAGYHFLADRQWLGSRRAQVDLVVIGPGGVFIVDTKAWAEVQIVSGNAGDRIYRGQADVTDDVMKLADLANDVEGALAEVGLAPGEVHATIALAGRSGISARVRPVEVVGDGDILRHIASCGQRLTDLQVNTVLAAALDFLPPVGAPAPVNAALPEPVIEAPPAAIEQGELVSEEEIEAALLEGLMAAPIEQWMTFLHPAQAKIVRRSYHGPSRIRGAAGTGKTVVGLHRAAYLARTRPGSKVLVTTYVRTLPKVLGSLLERMAPDVADCVEFSGVHQFARRILDERGIDIHLNKTLIDNAWNKAWNDRGRESGLAQARVTTDYWREEVTSVIKARGITRFDQYADLARTGRRHRLTLEQRREVWDLYRSYEDNLRHFGTRDWQDMILLAAAELVREPCRDYASVIVDEAQDLSAAAVRMLHSLVGDAPDGLTLIGDGQQSIYPGGYTLSELGIAVTGRAAVLDINYRNTREIIEFAGRMVVGDEFSDIDEVASQPVLNAADVAGQVTRSGPVPEVVQFGSWKARRNAVVERVRAVTRDVGTNLGDVAVLCVGNGAAADVREDLHRAGIASADLLDYDGSSSDAVKVGTIKRAKGLEFKQVLLADVRSKWLAGSSRPQTSATASSGEPKDESPKDEATREKETLLRRELYVAMTRARDGLWVGVV
ncbi:hypothetical protein GCM10010401_12290 [Rarobacter faecitabidus]|uniref:DNA 3'-5' helicase n=1 Tax=Rarobacter faecitabidus TaxID=13243 RepID=A0A542ZNV2_RARFA|nr:UvrD-helicase domain-containing protein [Rarobacter faecitabidus]TQL62033.1 UvrD-like helicase family protein [Rarobacter faecitabidus]